MVDYVNEKRLEKGWYIERCGDVYPLFSEKWEWDWGGFSAKRWQVKVT